MEEENEGGAQLLLAEIMKEMLGVLGVLSYKGEKDLSCMIGGFLV